MEQSDMFIMDAQAQHAKFREGLMLLACGPRGPQRAPHTPAARPGPLGPLPDKRRPRAP